MAAQSTSGPTFRVDRNADMLGCEWLYVMRFTVYAFIAAS